MCVHSEKAFISCLVLLKLSECEQTSVKISLSGERRDSPAFSLAYLDL